MFDKIDWIWKWMQDNPKDVFGPAIVLGTIGGAAVATVLVVTWGNPWQTASIQTGPRGTAMDVTKEAAYLAAPDPGSAGYVSSAPIVPDADAVLAKDAIEGFEPLLGDLTVDNYNRLVAAMREWTGIPTLFEGEETYQTVVARSMIRMTQAINADWASHVGTVGVNCYTCHRGQPVPAEVWFEPGAVNKVMVGWGGVQNRRTPLSQFTSLPSDAMQKFLLEYGVIAVHDLEPRVPGGPSPSRNSLPSWQDTERTYSLMNHFANSMNVNCTFCHNTRAFYDPEQHTPQWTIAQLGIALTLSLNNDWLVPLRDVLPAERLGPVNADAPKANCATCHLGYAKPLDGRSMIADWPELASSELPVYAE